MANKNDKYGFTEGTMVDIDGEHVGGVERKDAAPKPAGGREASAPPASRAPRPSPPPPMAAEPVDLESTRAMEMAPQGDAERTVLMESPVIDRPKAYVTIVGGQDKGKEVPLRAANVLVGRGLDCDLVLNDPSVSRKHFNLVLVGDKYKLVDLGSGNGTTVNGQRVKELVLEEGTELKSGTTIMRIGYGGLAAAAPAPRDQTSTAHVPRPPAAQRQVHAEVIEEAEPVGGGSGKIIAIAAVVVILLAGATWFVGEKFMGWWNLAGLAPTTTAPSSTASVDEAEEKAEEAAEAAGDEAAEAIAAAQKAALEAAGQGGDAAAAIAAAQKAALEAAGQGDAGAAMADAMKAAAEAQRAALEAAGGGDPAAAIAAAQAAAAEAQKAALEAAGQGGDAAAAIAAAQKAALEAAGQGDAGAAMADAMKAAAEAQKAALAAAGGGDAAAAIAAAQAAAAEAQKAALAAAGQAQGDAAEAIAKANAAALAAATQAGAGTAEAQKAIDAAAKAAGAQVAAGQGAALGEPAAADDDVRALFEGGLELTKDQRWDDALAKFAAVKTKNADYPGLSGAIVRVQAERGMGTKLDDAKRKLGDGQTAKGLELLKSIPETSSYYVEATTLLAEARDDFVRDRMTEAREAVRTKNASAARKAVKAVLAEAANHADASALSKALDQGLPAAYKLVTGETLEDKPKVEKPKASKADFGSALAAYKAGRFDDAVAELESESKKSLSKQDQARAKDYIKNIKKFRSNYSEGKAAAKAFQAATATGPLEKSYQADQKLGGHFSGELKRMLADMNAYRAASYFAKNEYGTAAVFARKSLSFDPNQQSASQVYSKSQEKAESLHQQGMAAWNGGNKALAGSFFRQVIKILPESHPSYKEAYSLLGQMDE